MEVQKIINLTKSNINSTNIYLASILLIVFIYIVLKTYSDLYLKIYPNITNFTLDIRYLISNAQTSDKFIKQYIHSVIKKILGEKIKPIDDKLKNRKSTINDLDKSVGDLENSLINNNVKKITNYQQTYLSMNNVISFLSNSLNQMNDIQIANIEAVDKIYEKYSYSMQDYINKLLNVLSIINYHINVSYIKPNMQKMIQPLQKLYNSIYNTLVNNSDFLKKFIPTFDPESVQKLSTKLDTSQDLSVKFKTSPNILRLNGY